MIATGAGGIVGWILGNSSTRVAVRSGVTIVNVSVSSAGPVLFVLAMIVLVIAGIVLYAKGERSPSLGEIEETIDRKFNEHLVMPSPPSGPTGPTGPAGPSDPTRNVTFPT